MATAKTRGSRRRPTWLKVVLVLVLALAALGWLYREPLYGLVLANVAGRSLKDCQKDFEPRMEAVFLSDDEDERSVTGYVPLIASETARYRKGYGCVLEPWDE